MPWSEKKTVQKHFLSHKKKIIIQHFLLTSTFSSVMLNSYKNGLISIPASHCVRPIKHANKSLWRPRLFLYNFFFLLFYF